MTKPAVPALIALLVAVAACDGGQSKADAGGKSRALAVAANAGVIGQPPGDDLFAFAAGARFVAKPDDADYAFMAYTPYNLLDETPSTDWSGTAGQGPAVFVLELPERTAISRVAFDSAGMNRDEKSPKAITVEVSDVSATDGFKPALAVELKQAANAQSFALPQKAVGRWVRLTLRSNYGDDYYGLTGFHGYGEALTHEAKVENVSGAYEGASGWGVVRLKQEGSRVVGCYTYRDGLIAGGVDGRLLKVEMTEKSETGPERELGLFAFSPDGKSTFGLTRKPDRGPDEGYNAFYSAVKVSDDIGDCPAIPGWKSAGAAGSQLSEQLETEGRARLDGVNFDFNSATIQPASKPLLDQVAQMLKDKADWKVSLEGHTDNIGGADFNKTLSAQRAAAVQAYLVAGGIPAARLSSAGFGFDRPVASNDTQGGRAQNRRVEIVKR